MQRIDRPSGLNPHLYPRLVSNGIFFIFILKIKIGFNFSKITTYKQGEHALMHVYHPLPSQRIQCFFFMCPTHPWHILYSLYIIYK